LSKGSAAGGANTVVVAAASNSGDGCASSLSQQLNMAAVAAAAASASSAASTALFSHRQQQRFCESNLGVGSESGLTGGSGSDWESKRGGGNIDEHGHYLYDYTYDPEWLRVESWLDEHPDFCLDYFLRYLCCYNSM